MMLSIKNSLIKKFAIYSFIAFAVTGTILAVVISMHVRSSFADTMPALEFEQHILRINQIIAGVVFFGLLILYFLLLRIIHSASKTLLLQNEHLVQQKDELEKAYAVLQRTYRETVTALSRAVDARDPYTAGHSDRVVNIASKIANKLGLNKQEIEIIELSAQFHDVGKIGIPDNILLKPGSLTEIEFAVIKEHPVIGVNILSNIEFLKDSLPIIRHHHERYDGNGYPDGTSGQEIPLGSRIISIADTYDAMTTDRPYRKGLSHEEAINEIIRCKGTQLDNEIVENAFDILRNLQAD